jgi:chromosome segregation ATPase
LVFSQLQSTLATLRMSLAEIQDKERQLDARISQFRTQLRRLPRQVVYGNTGLDASMSAMGEIEERLADVVASRRRLLEFKRAAEEELEALGLIKQVDEARHKLQALRQRVRASGEDPDSQAEIRRLESFIAEHSKRAEQAITARYEERQNQD